jgi:hypothetical protein
MPRLARLDAPGTVHDVIVRGIEKRAIVTDLADREEFVSRMGKAAIATGTTIYAWALLPNHAHILIRSGLPGLPMFMRKFLTGYAIRYNRRHRRHGHLFRARLVERLAHLDRYPWAGMRSFWEKRPTCGRTDPTFCPGLAGVRKRRCAPTESTLSKGFPSAGGRSWWEAD